MTEKNKRLIITGLVLAIFLTMTYGLYDLSVKNDQLFHELEDDVQTMKEMTVSLQKHSDLINRYHKMVSDCKIMVNGSSVSFDQVIGLLNNCYDSRDSLYDSLLYYKQAEKYLNKIRIDYQSKGQANLDSLTIYRAIANLDKKKYGIQYQVTSDGKHFRFVERSSRGDSAMLLFPYFKDKLELDSAKGVWIVHTLVKEIRIPNEREKSKRGRQKNN